MLMNSLHKSLALAVLLLSAQSFAALAQEASPVSGLDGWTLGVAPYTYHFSDARKEHSFEPDDERHADVWLVTAERRFDEHQLAGLALFNNSFGQFSQYAYYGWQFRPWNAHPQLFLKLTGGVIHGYKYPYHKKIPFNNRNGWGVTVIPGVGWDFDRHWGAQVNVLGTSALMFQVNYMFR